MSRCPSRTAPVIPEHRPGTSLTSPQGVRIPDTDHSLKAGPRGPILLEDFHLREKITPLRPRAHPGARGPRPRRGRARRLHRLRHGRVGHPGGLAGREGPGDPGLRAVLDGARLARFRGHGARRPRLRDEVLHEGGQLGPRRQQHPGLLHPGRDQVPGHHPRRQAATRPGDPAGAVGARHVLGLRLACTPRPPTTCCGDVRSRHPAQLPDDGGLRRPHLPPGQRRAARRRWSSSTGSRRSACTRWSGRRRRSPRASTPTSTAATWRTRSRPAPSRSGSSACRSSRTPPDETFEGIDLLDPTKIVPEELAPVQPIGKLTLNRNPTTSSPRPSRSPSTPRTSCPASS